MRACLTDDDVRRLTEALERVRDAILSRTLAFDPADEDIHSAVERGVTDLLGDLGAKLHAGRSRNDLVATDVRLHLLGVQATVSADVRALGRVLVERAREHAADPMPGSTHVRPAQPITLGHHLCAHAWALARDLERFADWRRRASVSPLGAGALATSTLGLDPVATAERLGFDRAFDNSLDAVSDRDVLQECVAVAAICATHLSRLAADLLRWTDPALGWAELDDAYSTGSSMMPQKRNPDTAELARAKAARITGDFVTLGAMLQGLPLGYQRDLQEDKEPAFDALATLLGVAQALRGAVATLRIDTAAMREACADPGLYATDVAEALVKTGVPFREAHRRTGEFLKRLDADGRTLRDATPQEWDAFGVPARRCVARPRCLDRGASRSRRAVADERRASVRRARRDPRAATTVARETVEAAGEAGGLRWFWVCVSSASRRDARSRPAGPSARRSRRTRPPAPLRGSGSPHP